MFVTSRTGLCAACNKAVTAGDACAYIRQGIYVHADRHHDPEVHRLGPNVAALEREPPPAPDPDAHFWTIDHVAAYCGIKATTVDSYREQGVMPPPDRSVGTVHAWLPATVIACRSTMKKRKHP